MEKLGDLSGVELRYPSFVLHFFSIVYSLTQSFVVPGDF